MRGTFPIAQEGNVKRKEQEKLRKARQKRMNKSNVDAGKDEDKFKDGLLPMSEPCPIGWIQVKMVQNELDTEGELYWADPQKLKDDGKQQHRLTAVQMARIRAFKRILAEHEQMSEETAFYNFSRDRHPENEIAIWERIASAYENEIELRPDADAEERHLLYQVLLAASSVGLDSGRIVSSVPKAKTLPHLERALDALGNT